MQLDREVALKVHRPEGREAVHLFPVLVRESRLLEGFSHPGVIRFHDRGYDGEWFFLAMDLHHGTSLREHLQATGRLEAQDAIGVALQVAQALAALHHRRVVHRDLNHDNVILGADGVVRIADLGLPWSHRTFRALEPGRFGTVACLAPEILKIGAHSESGDVHALGALLYHMLSGCPPVPLEGPGAVDGDSPRTPVPLRRRVNVDSEILELVDAMLAGRPENRPSAGEVTKVLEGRAQRVTRGWIVSGSATRTIGPYQVMDPLGEGGMGQVFRARHSNLDRLVALKVLPVEREPDARLLDQFSREMKLSVRLVHPSLVRVLDCEITGNTPYIAMELIEGLSLRQRLDSAGRMTWREVLSAGHQLSLGLSYLHSEGVLHRDIKPSNILIGAAGEYKLADFGISLVAADRPRTLSGVFVGTWSYAAPERLLGERHTESADLWSLGMVLFEALTGERPVPAAGYLAWAMTGGRHLDPPGCFVPEIPAPVSLIVMGLLERDPARRTGSARQLVEQLEELLQDHLRTAPDVGLAPSPSTGNPADSSSRITDVTEGLQPRPGPAPPSRKD